MTAVNWSSESRREFILLRLSEDRLLKIPFFTIFLAIYMITLLGNLAIMSVIRKDPRLHTPMYFFLSNLSFTDACYSSVTLPKLLANIIAEKSLISFAECMAQLFFFMFFASAQCFHVSVMAFDRYVAICSPLHYSVIMNRCFCLMLVTLAWFGGTVNGLIHTVMISRLTFCKSNVVNHFSCDIQPLLQISCSNTIANEVATFVVAALFGIPSFLLVLISYLNIVSTILKIQTAKGRYKAFSTCASHFTAVLLFYIPGSCRYIRPRLSYSFDAQDKVVSVLYCTVNPMLNPIIYSLRNKDVKVALWKAMGWQYFLK